jgi:hypothetical protein
MRVLSRSAIALVATAALSGISYAADDESRFVRDPGPPVTGGFPAEAIFSEGFDTVVPAGWTQLNQAAPPGLTTWFQGNSAVFPAHSGAPTSYAGANFNNSTGAGNISSWLITPAMPFSAGEVVSFWTRTVTNPATFPDRLHLKYNTAGDLNTANFTTTLVSVNPNLTLTGYPGTWTQFSAVIPASTASGRIAFHYDVPGGGPAGANSDYIGVDTFAVVPEPVSLGTLALAGMGMMRRRRR